MYRFSKNISGATRGGAGGGSAPSSPFWVGLAICQDSMSSLAWGGLFIEHRVTQSQCMWFIIIVFQYANIEDNRGNIKVKNIKFITSIELLYIAYNKFNIIKI